MDFITLMSYLPYLMYALKMHVAAFMLIYSGMDRGLSQTEEIDENELHKSEHK